jgi:hypothetical protein
MLTLFACPKPFVDGHIALIQRNAIRSWVMLDPNLQIILIGDEPGVEEIAAEMGCEFIPSVQRNEFGTPLLNDVFDQAEARARYDVLCYINADIILMDDFTHALRAALLKGSRFLMGGRPWNLDITSAIVFSPGWQKRLREHAKQTGALRSVHACDYFVFSKGLWPTLPPFAVGRAAFDNALLYRARKSRGLLIDATCFVVAVHQNHNYSAAVAGANSVTNPEALRNVVLAGGPNCLYNWQNATHVVSDGRVKRSWSGTLKLWGFNSGPTLVWQRYVWFPFLGATRPVRHKLGWRRHSSH